MRNSTIVYPVKVEYGSEISNIFVLKMMMKSGLEKTFLRFLHAHNSDEINNLWNAFGLKENLFAGLFCHGW